MRMSKSKTDVSVVVGGESRITLLPPEVAARAQAKSTQKAMVGVVVIAVLVTGAGFVSATISASNSAAQLVEAQSRTTDLIQQQGEYIMVRQMQNELDTVTIAQQVGTSTEINWKSYLDSLRDALPADVRLTTVTVEVGTPLTNYAQASVPLQGPRVGTVILEAVSPSIPEVQSWLAGLASVPGYVDATPGSVSSLADGSGYTVNVTMHIDSNAFSNRFAPITSTEEVTP